jgi:hypothetical protein
MEDLDFDNTTPKQRIQKSAPAKHGKVKPEGPPCPVEREDAAKPSLGWKVARLVAYLIVIAGAIVFNEFYGYPLRDSRWLKLETYRTVIDKVFASEEYTVVDGTGTKTMNITGIAYSSEKPSAMIGGRIVYVGDVVSDATVMRIGPKEVVFREGDRTWTEKVH